MAHELEQFTDGTTAFVSANIHPWHRLGTVVDHTMTAEEIMSTARLANWNVHKSPLGTTVFSEDGITHIDLPDHFATVRTHPQTGEPQALGVVGTGYTPIQNEAMCELLNTIVDESGAHFETAGSLRGGKQIFVTMKMPETIKIAGVDDVDLYFAASNSHDGSSAANVVATPVRVVCANTQRAAIERARSTYSFKHTKYATSRVSEARAALGVMWSYFDEFQASAERMINESLTMGQFEDIVKRVWPEPADLNSRAGTNHTRRLDNLRYLFSDGDKQAAISGTHWAGYQAITEYLDHHAPAKDEDVRAHRVLTSPSIATTKERAFALLTV